MYREKLIKLLESIQPADKKEVWIWGAGNTAQLYSRDLSRLEKNGEFHFEGYCDNNRDKWGTSLNDKEVISPQELFSRYDVLVLICSIVPERIQQIKEELSSRRISAVSIDAFFLNRYKEKVLNFYDLLDDERSREIFYLLVECRVHEAFPSADLYSDNQYFAIKQFAKRDFEEVFVDCGAYVGDSVEQYIWHKMSVFKKIIAFEPDEDNYRAMEKRMIRLKEEWNIPDEKIELRKCGLGDKQENLAINKKGSGSSLSVVDCETEDFCCVTSVDAALNEKIGFIKADIEGSEYEMLLGAKESIRRYTPLIAVAIYHNAIALFDIALLIHGIDSKYHFSIRHHSFEMDETVLYAWTE